MKAIVLFFALIAVVAFSSCSAPHYVTRPATHGKYYGNQGKHRNDNNRNYNNGHGNRGPKRQHGW